MNDDQITALAREYAEQTDGSPADIAYRKAIAENTLRFLLRRFCLVEKKQVIEEYKSAKHDSKMAHRERLYTMLAAASARKALLESLFPEIGKEVEE